MKRLLLLILCGFFSLAGYAQRYSISGTVRAADTKEPIGMAVVTLAENNLWAVADEKGYFEIKGIQAGEYQIQVSSLGYISFDTRVSLRRDHINMNIDLKPDNLTIDQVVVTAKENSSAMSTVRTIEKTALDHLQVVNISDISSMLPGGRTQNPNLLTDNVFSLRDGGSNAGNASFGTAVEVDGVRLSTNTSFGDISGASTRNIASSNVESIEVITGIPSVEYGDVGSGIVKIHTQKGRTPYTATFTTNPNTKQFSLAKGFGLGGNAGVLNVGLETTRATKDPMSPYESYSRNTLDVNYSNTFNRKGAMPLRMEAGVAGNIGGLNSKDDPDAFTGQLRKVSDNALRFHTKFNWLINKPWITNLELSLSGNYADKVDSHTKPNTASSNMPSIHVTEEGYYLADLLPKEYVQEEIISSKEVEATARLKATWARRFGKVMNNIKAGVDYKISGNVGDGEYFKDPSLATHSFRPRDYSDIPFMNNIAFYIEENVNIPFNKTSLSLMAGIRAEKTIIKDMLYDKAQSISPRFNAKYTIIDKRHSKGLSKLSIRGGYGITEKLPSFNILYPRPGYRDIPVFSQSDGVSAFHYYAVVPYSYEYNENLRWMRNNNAEAGIDAMIGKTRISLTGFYNITNFPYRLNQTYTPYQYTRSNTPKGYTMPSNPGIRVDQSTGKIYISDLDNTGAGETEMPSIRDYTFVKRTFQDNGSPVHRRGLELVVDFGQIKALKTSFRIDASYTNTRVHEDGDGQTSLYWNYPESGRHSDSALGSAGRSYEYLGIYPYTTSSSGTANYRVTNELTTNLTVITQIPSVRMVISLRLEGALITSWQNKSLYNGEELAYKTDGETVTPAPGSIYDRDAYSGLWPLYYMDLQGNIFPFTEAQANDPAFQRLIRTGGAYNYNKGGYKPYFMVNLSITKEIGNIASVSFYANNATNMRKYMVEQASRINVIRTQPIFYGLTLRLKF